MCVPAEFRGAEVLRESAVAGAMARFEEELDEYLDSAEAAFFTYLAELERAGS